MSNQAWQITAPGTLTLNNIDTVPDPGAKEVVVRIHAVALNYRDKLVIDHNPAYPVKHKANLVPTCDGAGIVEDSGQSSRWKKGDRVVVNPNTWIHGADGRDFELDKALGGGENDGTLRKWMTVSDESLLRAPENLSMEEASTIFTAGVTAYRSLFYGGVKLQPGVTVLTQGTGGVSCYAIMVKQIPCPLLTKLCSCSTGRGRGGCDSRSNFIFRREASSRSKARGYPSCELPNDDRLGS